MFKLHVCFLAPCRAAESAEEVCSLRPPRLIHEDGIIRPYDRRESEGCDLFEVNPVLHGLQ